MLSLIEITDKQKNTTPDIMYKTLEFKWLFDVFCPASAFVTADSYDARNPQTLHICNRSLTTENETRKLMKLQRYDQNRKNCRKQETIPGFIVAGRRTGRYD